MSVSCLENTKKNAPQTNVRTGSIDEFLSIGNFDKLQHIMYPVKMKAGNYLFWEGDEATSLYYIRSGRLKLNKSSEEGNDLILSFMNKGDLVGEYGDGSNTFHDYSAEVIENVEAGMIKIKDLETLLYEHGDFAIEFMKWLGLTQRKTQSKFRDLLLFGKAGALASTLIRMSNTYGVTCADGIRLEIKLTNTEIADFIGMTRESVNRLLNSWKEKGTIDIKKGMIIIKNIQNLRCICHCPTYPSCPKEICRI